MRQRSTLNVWLVVLTAVCLVPHAFGQATLSFAQLNGTVLDTSGRIVVGATISARNLGTNQSYAATTNSSGYYVVPNLPPGPTHRCQVCEEYSRDGCIYVGIRIGGFNLDDCRTLFVLIAAATAQRYLVFPLRFCGNTVLTNPRSQVVESPINNPATTVLVNHD
ncbi:MAG TPA: carboxypeptidase-like regulatory domain-containing protein [Candidatus Dormibacteraeota bacterium]|nr:carboxypeptidase-like regulatory domain-containing protein [Candidatus Dormibacteraeota bacterium]